MSLSLRSGMTFLSQVSVKAEAAREKNTLMELTVPGTHTEEAARESRGVFNWFKGEAFEVRTPALAFPEGGTMPRERVRRGVGQVRGQERKVRQRGRLKAGDTTCC